MSYSFLFGVPGKLKKLLNRLTETRAGYLDNLPRLDVNVSSRANGAYYTSARAAKLDNLDTTISSRLSASDSKIVRLDEFNRSELVLTPTTDMLGDMSDVDYLISSVRTTPPVNSTNFYLTSGLDITPSASGTWETTFSYSGSGYLLACTIVLPDVLATFNLGVKLIVDGVSVFNSAEHTKLVSYDNANILLFPPQIILKDYGLLLAKSTALEISSSLSIKVYESDNNNEVNLYLLIKKKTF